MPSPSSLIRARWVIPITSPPIQGGWVRVAGQRVIDFGSGNIDLESGTQEIDLGDAALLPGLVNAHTHLEFSDCRLPIGRPGMPLAEWIGEVIKTRSATSKDAKNNNIVNGLDEAYHAGTSLIADIATPPCDYPSGENSPEVISFPEVLGLTSDRAEEKRSEAKQHLRSVSGGISPHAPYSTPWSLIQWCVDWAKSQQCPLAMHVAESPDERELISNGTGRFADSLRTIGVWQDGMFPWRDCQDFVPLIKLLAKAPSALLVHGNDLSEREIECLSHEKNVTVVYCPRTHDFFRHGKHPINQLLDAGIRVALGTDSRASNPDLSLWREVQFLLKHCQDIEPQKIIESGTRSGAMALQRPDFGIIAPQSQARFAVCPTTANTLDDLYRDCATHPLAPLKT